jgi:thymidine phosphorylase
MSPVVAAALAACGYIVSGSSGRATTQTRPQYP